MSGYDPAMPRFGIGENKLDAAVSAVVTPPATVPAADVMDRAVDSVIGNAPEEPSQNPVLAARLGMLSAVETDADIYARAVQVSRRTGLPIETILSEPDEAKRQDAMGRTDFTNLADSAPSTAALLADMDLSKLMHDDVEPMSGIERYARAFASGSVTGTGAGIGGVGFFGSATQRAFQNQLLGGQGDFLAQRLPDFGAPGTRAGEAVTAFGERLAPPNMTMGETIASGLGQAVPQVAVTLGTGGAGSAVFLGSQGLGYGAQRVQGFEADQRTKDIATVLMGATTAVTEKYALDKILGPLAAPLTGRVASALARVGTAAVSEGGQEFTEGVINDAIQRALIDPNQQIGAGALQEATVGGAVGAIIGSMVEATLHVRARGARQTQQAQAAQANATTMERMQELAKVSKLASRDPQTFETFLQEATKDGPVDTVYIDAKVLNQSPFARELAQVSPTIAEQLPQALETGAPIAITASEYLARIAPTEYSQSLLPDLRTDPDGFSKNEADDYIKNRAKILQEESDALLNTIEADVPFRESADRVRTTLLNELNAAGRFNPQANELYATLASSFFTTQAANTGVLPEQIYQQYPLRVTADNLATGQVLEQGAPPSRMMAVHSLTADNLAFADKMGGLAVPSIGVVTEATGNVGEFGDITLLGTEGLVDPKKTPVFSSDAYTSRFARAEWGKVKPADARKVASVLQDAAQEFDDPRIVIKTMEGMTDAPDAGEVVDAWLNSPAAMATYLRERGEAVAPVMRPVQQTTPIPADKLPTLAPLVSALDQSRGTTAMLESPEWEALADAYRKIIEERYSSVKPSLAAKLSEFSFAQLDGLIRDINRAGMQDVDQQQTRAMLREKIDAVDFKRWVEAKVLPAFGDPFLTAGGKKKPYTLDNIVAAMTGRNVKGIEKTLTHGAGKTRAAASVKFTNLEQMRKAASEMIANKEDYEAARQQAEKELDAYRGMVVEYTKATDWQGKPDTWEALDGSMRALAKWITSKNQSAADMRTALASENFDAARIPDAAIAQAMKAGKALMTAPVPYFEAKPQRAVTLDEFRGAVIPSDAPQSVRDILEKHGIKVAEYAPGTAPESAIRGLASQLQGTLFQGARGSFNPETLVINLTQAADFSTFLHESAHFFLEAQIDIAARIAQKDPATLSAGERQIAADTQAVMKWFGLSGPEEWVALPFEARVPFHEQFARGFEAYIYEGKAPSLELHGVFRRLRAFLISVYKSITRLGVQLNPEIRGVFDRLIATNQQIQMAEQNRAMAPLIGEGLTPEVLADLHKQFDDATMAAVEELQARSLRDFRMIQSAKAKKISELNKEAAGLRKGIEEKVREEVMARPVYRAWEFLKTPDGKLARSMAPQLDALKMVKNEGLHPDIAAELMGFASGDEMIQAIVSATPPELEIEALTDIRMIEEHGDLSSPAEIERAADMAVHNPARLKAVANQANALAKATGGRRILAAGAKALAEDMVAKLQVGKVRPGSFASAEARAAKAAQTAFKKGDLETAAAESRNQVVMGYATRAAYEAQAEIKKINDGFARIAKTKKDDIGKTRDGDLTNLAMAILADYGVGMRGKRPRSYLDLVQAYDDTTFQYLEPLLRDAEENAKPLKELTVDELRGLRDTVQSIWTLAKRSRQVEIDGKKMALDAVRGELAARIETLGVPESFPGQFEAPTDTDKFARKIAGTRAHMRRVEHWVTRMDGGKVDGPFHKYVFQPISDAAELYRADSAKYRKRYKEMLDAIRPSLTAEKISAPALRYTFKNKAELLSAMTHTGNESNFRKLLLGRKWGALNEDGTLNRTAWDATVNDFFARGVLTKEDMDFVQGIWDLHEEIKPLAQKAHRDVFGRYFDEITTWEAQTPVGTYTGGYVPATADSFAVQDAAVRAELEAVNESNTFMLPATARGFTKSRVDSYTAPLLLDLNVIPMQLDKVLRFSHLEPRVRDATRVLGKNGIQGLLSRYDSVAYKDMLLPWLNRAAKQTVETPSSGEAGRFADSAFRYLRRTTGAALMFGNVTNALQQVTGLAMSAVKVKPAYLKAALWQYVRDPSGTSEAITALSPFMANRLDSSAYQMRGEIETILTNPNVLQRADGWTQRHAYFLQSAMQSVVDITTWRGAFDQALAQDPNVKRAIRAADSAVRETQGSFSPEDISAFEAGSPLKRAFTQFTGYFNMQANMLATELTVAQREKLGKQRQAAIVTLGFILPTLASAAIVAALRGEIGDEDDDGYLDDFLAFFLLAPAKGALAMIPFGGQALNLTINRFNANMYDDRLSMAPWASLLESSAGVPYDAYRLATGEDVRLKPIARDVLSLVALTTGLPGLALAKPIGYGLDVAQGYVTPTGPVDLARGLVSGAASEESKQ